MAIALRDVSRPSLTDRQESFSIASVSLNLALAQAAAVRSASTADTSVK